MYLGYIPIQFESIQGTDIPTATGYTSLPNTMLLLDGKAETTITWNKKVMRSRKLCAYI